MTKTNCDKINELGQQSLEQLQNDASSKQADRVKLMGEILRSKGFIWLATSNLFIGGWQQAGNILKIALIGKYRPRFFDRVRHKTMYASSGNKHFFNTYIMSLSDLPKL